MQLNGLFLNSIVLGMLKEKDDRVTIVSLTIRAYIDRVTGFEFVVDMSCGHCILFRYGFQSNVTELWSAKVCDRS